MGKYAEHFPVTNSWYFFSTISQVKSPLFI